MTIERLEDELAKRAIASRAPIAIRSAALRVPGANSLAELRDLLWRGVDATREVPKDRWDAAALYDPRPEARGKIATRRGGFLEDVSGFDAAFFGISPREALPLDPQQRLLLELAWEAIERAGVAPDSLRGTKTGVFVGIGIADWATRLLRAGASEDIDAYTGIGTSLGFAAGRIAFHLGLQGPTLSVDTACSSSLVALHLACRALRAGECDLALVGGAHLMLAPETMMVLSRAGALSPDGRCKTFDASADGYGRGEGALMLVLSRLEGTQGAPLLGLIRGSAVNHDGPSSALTVPNGPAQEAVIQGALSDGGVSPHEVGYVEAHGTGTVLGDPLELKALANVYGKGRKTPLHVGSIKTNLGHLEAAAGLAGLLKLCLVLERGEVPPHLHLTRPNPHVDWANLPLRVPTAVTPWSEGVPRIGGVSAFGLSGTNAHVLVERAPAPLPLPKTEPLGPSVCMLSARTESALKTLAERAADHIEAHPELPLDALSYSLSRCRARFPERLVVTASSHAELARVLREKAASYTSAQTTAPCVAFLFTGQGSPYPGMGRELYAEEPVFRAVIDACAQLTPKLAVPLDAIVRGDIDAARLTDTSLAQPALFALQVALVTLWKSWGVEPDVVLGHSIGELAAAVTAGVFSLEEGLSFAVERGRAMGALPRGGAMVSLRAERARVEAALTPFAGRVSLAAHNGPLQSVSAGEAQAVVAVVRQLSVDGVAAVPLAVSHAFHSPLMEPALDAIGRAAPSAQTPRVTFVSTLTGKTLTGALDAAYWRKQAREAVSFVSAAQAAHAEGARVFVEIGPRPTLLPLLAGAVPALKGDAQALLASLRPGQSDRRTMRESLTALLERGAPAQLDPLFDAPARRYVDVPTYPFEHERFWIEARHDAPPSPAPTEARKTTHPLLESWVLLPSGETRFRALLTHEGLLAQHAVAGHVVVPFSLFVSSVHEALTTVFGTGPHRIDALSVHAPLRLPVEEPQEFELTLSPRRGDHVTFTLRARDAEAQGPFEELGSGSATLGGPRPHEQSDVAALRARCAEPFPLEALYAKLDARGVVYGPAYRPMREAQRGEGELFARVHELEVQRAGALDVLVQAIGFAVAQEGDEDLYTPVSASGCVAEAGEAAFVWARATRDAQGIRGSATLFDRDGRVLARWDELFLMRSRPEDLERAANARWLPWVHEVAFREVSHDEPLTGERWLLVTDGSAVSGAVRRALSDAGKHVVQAFASDAFAEVAPDLVEFDARGLEGHTELFTHAYGLFGALDAVVLFATGETDAARACARALHAAQALTSRAGTPPRFVIVTRGAQPLAGPATRVELATSTLWGFGRALAVEHPELRCTLVDLDPHALADHGRDFLHALCAEAEQLAVREGRVLAARLVAEEDTRAALTALESPGFRTDATYVITGGLGGLGQTLANHLVRRGVRHVALLSRKAPSAEASARIASWNARGAQVRTYAVDLADAAALARVVADIEAEGPPIRGVFHAAAVIDDALLNDQNEARLRAVLAPKVEGTLNLERALAEKPLDFFFVFSSLVSLLGATGQVNYAAANAFVDAFAVDRRARGLPVTAVQWGPWAGAGTAQTHADQRRWSELGLFKIPPSAGLSALERAPFAGRASFAVLPIHWETLFARLPAELTPSLYAELRETYGASPKTAPTVDAAFVTSLRKASARDARAEILLPWLRREAAQVLRLKTPDALSTTRPLSELGFDSLLAVELRNVVQRSLGMTVPVSALFAHPTLEGLALHLAEIVEAEPSAPPPLLRLVDASEPKGPNVSVSLASPKSSSFGVDLSLIYFASGTSGPDEDKYKHVRAQAELADEAGFRAIWIPERHFCEFGALYPDPSVLAAALATITTRIRLRAGSAVAPLHHPMQLAERWAMVDNLSGGRVDLAIASGWSPVDFLFAPQHYAERLKVMRESIDTLKALWRGEPLRTQNGVGEPVEVTLYPRPVQRELSLWYTCSGSLERFVEAGAAGANVLTALLFQSEAELAARIAAYREARREHGHDPDAGVVTLMLHAYADEDPAQVLPTIREPFLAYLRSTAEVWLAVSSTETVQSIEQMSETERADVLELAFHRYVHSAGLFGTPAACAEKLRKLAAVGVNEVACLVDFGIPPHKVEASLRLLATLLPEVAADEEPVEELCL